MWLGEATNHWRLYENFLYFRQYFFLLWFLDRLFYLCFREHSLRNVLEVIFGKDSRGNTKTKTFVSTLNIFRMQTLLHFAIVPAEGT